MLIASVLKDNKNLNSAKADFETRKPCLTDWLLTSFELVQFIIACRINND